MTRADLESRVRIRWETADDICVPKAVQALNKSYLDYAEARLKEKVPPVAAHRASGGWLARLIRFSTRNMLFCSEGAQAPKKEGDEECSKR